LHLYSLQVIKDLAGSTPHPWLCSHFEGTDRSDSLNVGPKALSSSTTPSGILRVERVTSGRKEGETSETAARCRLVLLEQCTLAC
jgi:hypothetical protein